mmetsp:Transcript_16320/g.35753  ORF Transcript_16320/g.35753 Transcript_16320/m.35753 type:complete len:592 (-) Transcript_16320:123-1898(-)
MLARRAFARGALARGPSGPRSFPEPRRWAAELLSSPGSTASSSSQRRRLALAFAAAGGSGWAACCLTMRSAGPAVGESVPAAAAMLMLEAKAADVATWDLVRRAAWLFWSFSLVLMAAPAACLSKAFRESFFYHAIYHAIHFSRSAALQKWAQWASVRFDLFPAILCDLLARLQADGPKHHFDHTLAEVKAAGLAVNGIVLADGMHSEERRESAEGVDSGLTLVGLEETSHASGSIAQVHFASLGSLDGDRVAVKVRHPRVAEELLLDFEIMRIAASVIHDWVPALRCFNAPSTVSQFEAAMSGQCDLAQEAEHLQRFSTNFHRKAAWTVFPSVYHATEAVLVESFEKGELMSHFVKRWRGHELPDDERDSAHFVITRGEDCYLQMLLVDNFMHADLHPGNILYRAHGPTGKPQIILLDAGMAADLNASERANFIGMLQALGDGDGDALASRLLCFSDKQQCDNEAHFRAAAQTLCEQQCRGYGTNADVGAICRECLQLLYRHGVSIDGNYATLIANMLCLEGLAKDLEPQFNVLDIAYPLLRAHQILGDAPFQRCFAVAAHFCPLPLWEAMYEWGLYAGLNGHTLKKYQI